MEIIKPLNRSNIKRAPRIRVDKSPEVLSRISAVCNKEFSKPRLIKLINSLAPRDQAALLTHFFKPAPIQAPRDEFDNLSDESLDKLAAMLTNRSKQAYK